MDKWWKITLIKQFSGKMKNEKGDMLILSLLVTALFLTFGAGYLGLLVVEGNSTERTFQLNQAFHAAESGAEEAIWEIKYNSSTFDGWDTSGDPYTKTGTLTDNSGNTVGTYNVSVASPTSSTPTITSVGSAMFKAATISENRTIVVDLNVPSSSVYNYAAFAETSVTMDSNACTDSFNSSLGAYNSRTNKGSNGDVGTNSTSNGAITLDSNAEIDGDAYAGESGDPDDVIDAGARDITGSTAALDAAVSISSVTAPSGLTNKGAVVYNGNGSYEISSSGQYSDLTFDGNTTTTITGNIQIYVTDDFVMDSNSEIVISPGSSLEIYVDDSFTMSSNSDINNNTSDPSKLMIYGTDSLTGSEGIKFDSNTSIYGVIHAKNSGVKLSSNANIYGAILADTVDMDSNTCIHFDENLGSGGGGGGSGASVTFWHEK